MNHDAVRLRALEGMTFPAPGALSREKRRRDVERYHEEQARELEAPKALTEVEPPHHGLKVSQVDIEDGTCCHVCRKELKDGEIIWGPPWIHGTCRVIQVLGAR